MINATPLICLGKCLSGLLHSQAEIPAGYRSNCELQHLEGKKCCDRLWAGHAPNQSTTLQAQKASSQIERSQLQVDEIIYNVYMYIMYTYIYITSHMEPYGTVWYKYPILWAMELVVNVRSRFCGQEETTQILCKTA